jgi:hypothetical protein
MKMTQAYAWLAAGVLAAGLNASYHDGGLQRVHEIVDRVEHNSAAVLVLASGHADWFLSEVRWVTEREQTASCPLSATLARVQTRLAQSELVHSQLARTEPAMTEIAMAEIARNQTRLDRFQAMADREQARIEVNRARIEVQAARIRIPAVALRTMVFSAPSVECPRVRVSVPRLPRIQVPEIPVIHVETASGGPI